MHDPLPPSARDVWRARARIQGLIRRTPLLPAPEFAAHDGAAPAVWIKDETRQPTGAFKIRGAASALRALPDDVVARGVVAVSTGNHGRAVAHVARALGVPARVYVSSRVPPDKLDALRAAGARVEVHGDSQDQAEDAARARVETDGGTLIPPFDHVGVIAGQGTLGLELLEDLPDLDTVLAPLSGGGLIAGVARAVKAVAPDVRVVGVSMEAGAAMHASLSAGRIVETPEADTLADSLQGGLGRSNRYTFALVRALVDDVLLVGERALAEAMRHAFHHHRLVLEGGGAAALAALTSGATHVRGPTAVIASGSNVGAGAFARVLSGRTPAGEEHRA
ncbi:MAG: pyridoxal-phosphate dependent enzyme [Trueperaceae bacterium]|nr:pyridoxal-phosphate dependent enzyme [Trueperaceae bacterium]